MIVEMIRRSIFTLGFTAIITFVFLTVMVIQDMQVPVATIWENMLGSMVMAIYFGASSLLFEMEWSPLKQTVIHFLLSIGIWLPIALFIGWLPLAPLPILLGIGIFIVVYLLFWYGSYVYFKKVENEMNNSVKR